jgi:hypothetical protein
MRASAAAAARSLLATASAALRCCAAAAAAAVLSAGVIARAPVRTSATLQRWVHALMLWLFVAGRRSHR